MKFGKHWGHTFRIVCVSLLVTLLFVAPYTKGFQSFLQQGFILSRWHANQGLLIQVFGDYKVGNFIEHRVGDTLGILGFAPLLLIPLILFLKQMRQERYLRILTLGLLPFIVFFIPLFTFSWVSNIWSNTYWRICYSSLFWIPVTLLLFKMEGFTTLFASKVFQRFSISCNTTGLKRAYFFTLILALFVLAAIRSAPIYGKLDFLLLDSRPWWPDWKEIIEYSLREPTTPVDTDAMTASVLISMFNIPLVQGGNRPFGVMQWRPRYYRRTPSSCLINLSGFASSWVPLETEHWNPKLSNTSSYYSEKVLMLNTDNCKSF